MSDRAARQGIGGGGGQWSSRLRTDGPTRLKLPTTESSRARVDEAARSRETGMAAP